MQRFPLAHSLRAPRFQLVLACIGLLAVGPRDVAAGPLFGAPFLSYETGGRYAISVAIADVDEDGHPDLLAAHEGEPATGFQPITVLLSNGDGTFRKSLDVPTGWGPSELVCSDLDGDGHLDLAVADGGSAALEVFLGTGDGRFGPKRAYLAGAGAASVAAGDVDGDEVPDLVVANGQSNTVSFFRGLGAGAFAPAVHAAVPGGPRSVRLGDLNGDGRADLAVACSTSDAVSVLMGNGDGTFAAAVPLPSGRAPKSVAIHDLNADGRLDLVCANFGSSSATVFLGNGDGTFHPKSEVPVGDSYALDNPQAVAVGDVNGDAHLDLAVGSRSNIWVLLGNGDGAFQDGRILEVGFGPASGSGPSSVAIGDLDGDGRPDLAATTWRWRATVIVLPGNGDGSFGRGLEFATPGRMGSIAARDLDGDGRVDVVAANANQNGTVSVLLGNGDATFQDSRNLEAGIVPSSVLLEDLDGDARPEIVVANNDFWVPDPNEPPLQPRTISVFPSNGDGTFAARVEIHLAHRTSIVATGDLNGDHVADLVVPAEDADRISILLGNGDGTFRASDDALLGSAPNAVAIGDLDGDGNADLVVSSAGTAITVLTGRGDGTFVRWPAFATTPYTERVALADLDGDSHLDLVEFGYSQISIRYGTGRATFHTWRQHQLWMGPVRGAIGDLNQDGRMDLVVTSVEANTVSVLFGDGTGGFLPKQDFGTAHGADGVAIADLNGDARPEILVVTENSILVLVNGDSSIPTPVAVEDFEGAAADGSVLLAWRLSPEAVRTLRGVHVQRASAALGPYRTLTATPLAPSAGATYRDPDVEAGRDYWYRLSLLSEVDAEQPTAPIQVRTAMGSALRTILHQPFEPSGGRPVSIRFSIAQPRTPVELSIFDPRGRCIWSSGRTLHDSGAYTLTWDRRDRSGASVTRGIYFVQMRAGAVTLSKKMALLCR